MPAPRPSPTLRSSHRTLRSSLAVIGVGTLLGPLLGACGSSVSARPTGTWTLTAYMNRAGRVDAAPRAAQMTFAPDGTVTGNTGCNDFGGRWSTSGTTLKFSSVGMTAKACDAATDAQETALGVAFSKPQTYAIDGDTMTIGAADGATSLVLERNR